MTSGHAASICIAFAVAAAACAPGGGACAGPTCGAGYECLANRCAVAGGVPVARDSERLVLSPVELAVATDGGESSAPAVTLGSARDENASFYVRFGSSYKGREVAAAFLLLTVSPGTEPEPEDVPLEVWALGKSWSQASLSRGVVPGRARPMVRGIARSSPPSPVRVDVTRIIRELSRTPADDGVAIVASASHGAGVTLVTSAAGAPRLEVYLARPRRPAGAW